MKRFLLTRIDSLDEVRKRHSLMEASMHENLRYDGSVSTARSSDAGVYMRSPNGTIWLVQIDNAGVLTPTAVASIPD